MCPKAQFDDSRTVRRHGSLRSARFELPTMNKGVRQPPRSCAAVGRRRALALTVPSPVGRGMSGRLPANNLSGRAPTLLFLSSLSTNWITRAILASATCSCIERFGAVPGKGPRRWLNRLAREEHRVNFNRPHLPVRRYPDQGAACVGLHEQLGYPRTAANNPGRYSTPVSRVQKALKGTSAWGMACALQTATKAAALLAMKLS